MKINHKLLALIAASLVFAACSKPADKPAEAEATTTEPAAEVATAEAVAPAEPVAEEAAAGGEGEFASGSAVVVSEDLVVEAGTEGTDGLETTTIE